jgi:ParB/RepB/Spo0J family partition protein
MTLIPIKSLRHFSGNPRDSITQESVETLAASLQSEGQLQNLVVRKKSAKLYEVIVGNRRLSAFILLIERGLLPADHQAECVVIECDDETALRVALQENMQRADLDPMAEAEAFAVIVPNKGLEETAAMFGYKPAYVRQRLALASLSKEVKKAYHGAKIGLSVAEALTSATPDMQVLILKMIDQRQFSTYNGSLADNIRQFIVKENFPVEHALFSVRDSGLEVVSDLFGTTQPYFKDKAEAMRLQQAEVTKIHNDWRAKGYPPERIHSYTGAPPNLQEYGNAGPGDPKCVILHVAFNGKLTVYQDRIDKAEMTRRAEAERAAASAKRKAIKETALESGSIEDLSPQNLKRHAEHISALAWSVAVMDNTRIAKMMAIRYLQKCGCTGSIPHMFAHETKHPSIKLFLEREEALYGTPQFVGPDYTNKARHIEDVKTLDLMSDTQLDQILAFEVARTTDHEFSEQAYARLNPDIRAHWTPDAWFLKRLPRAMLLKVCRDIGLDPAHDAKKSFLVELLASRFARGEGKTWLPDLFVQHTAVSEEGTDYDPATGEIEEYEAAAE